MCDDSFTTRVATTIQGYKKVRVTKCMSKSKIDDFNKMND